MAEQFTVDTVMYLTSGNCFRYEVREGDPDIVRIQYQEYRVDKSWHNKGEQIELPLDTLKLLCKYASQVIESNAVIEGRV